MNVKLLAQAFGIVGVILFVLSFQIKSNKKLYFVQIMANIMFAIQFILLGAYVGCFSLLICIVRNALFMNRRKWKFVDSPVTLIVLLALYLLNTILNWNAWYDILPLAAVVSATVAFWTGNPRSIRTYNLFIASPSWMAYDICVGAWAGVLNEAIGMASIIDSIIRICWKPLGEGGDEFEK